ncbi:MAG: hypothetical protein IJX44_02760 [Bacteroidaceae bacterium]|nr:hypothetical protein [Bacteroidaceae bacterium]
MGNDEKWAYSSPIAIGPEENSHRSADKQLSEYGRIAIHRRLGWLSVSSPIAILPQTGKKSLVFPTVSDCVKGDISLSRER